MDNKPSLASMGQPMHHHHAGGHPGSATGGGDEVADGNSHGSDQSYHHAVEPTSNQQDVRATHIFTGYGAHNYASGTPAGAIPTHAPRTGTVPAKQRSRGLEDDQTGLFPDLPEARKRKFVLVEDNRRGSRLRVRVTLDGVDTNEIPDSFRTRASVFPRSFFPREMQNPPPNALGAHFFSDDASDDGIQETDGRGTGRRGSRTASSVSVKVPLPDSHTGEMCVPRMRRSRRERELKLNDMGHRMAWLQSRVFSGRNLFLQRASLAPLGADVHRALPSTRPPQPDETDLPTPRYDCKTHTKTPKMTYPHQATNIDGNHHAVAELEAPQTRPARCASPHAVVFELSGESSVQTQSGTLEALSPTETIPLPQANPWPFYLEDGTSTRLSHGTGRASDVTSDNQHPANPWPYHGIESDHHGENFAIEHGDEPRNSSHMTLPSNMADGSPFRESSSNTLEGKDAVELDGSAKEDCHAPFPHRHKKAHLPGSVATAYAPSTGEDSASFVPPEQDNTPVDGCVLESSAMTSVPEPPTPAPVAGKPHADITHESFENAHNSIATTNEPKGEDVSHSASLSAHQIPNQAGLYDALPPQQTWQSSARPYYQPPPPYSFEEASAFALANQPTANQFQGQHPHSPSTPAAQPFMPAPSQFQGQHPYSPSTAVAQSSTPPPAPSSNSPGQPLFPSSRLHPEAPPLPPRSPRQHNHVLGLSDGPHSNVAFPPPPKRHNVPPARYPPPLPQRPTTSSSSPFTSSSKFLGSSSAKKWIEKTNQAIEDTLDAVLQGPAGHPSRPAYVNRPQQPGQQTPHLSANRYNTTRFNSYEGRN
ncbi:hypothetical protein PWT90_03137 [Aphanocladium album]|nr:hypothetical protein PWT90_03137 [Aphanocladium album]